MHEIKQRFYTYLAIFKKSLPASLLWSLLLCIGIIPSLFFFLYFLEKEQELTQLEERISRLKTKDELVKSRESREKEMWMRIQNADRFYMDKQLENLVFLEPEIKRLEAICGAMSCDLSAKKRLQFLKGGENRLLFSEQQVQSYDRFR